MTYYNLKNDKCFNYIFLLLQTFGIDYNTIIAISDILFAVKFPFLITLYWYASQVTISLRFWELVYLPCWAPCLCSSFDDSHLRQVATLPVPGTGTQ
jgi:hypothetical protein